MEKEKQIRIANDWAIVRREKQLSKTAQKLEAYMIWKVDFDSAELPEVEISSRIVERCGIKRHDVEMPFIAEELLTYVIHYIQPDGDWGKTTLCSNFRKSGDSYIVRFDPALKPFFLELKKNFAQFSIHPLLAIGKSSYSHHLYQFLQTQIHSGNLQAWTRISLEDLKYLLGCYEEYPKWYDFQRYVLTPACKEISEGTDLKVEYKGERGNKGKAIKKIVFKIEKQDYQGVLFDLNDAPIEYELPKVIPDSVLKVCEVLTFKPLGRSKELLLNMVGRYSEENVVTALNLIQLEWGEAPDAVRGGIVHKILENYLKRMKKQEETEQRIKNVQADNEKKEFARKAWQQKFKAAIEEFRVFHSDKVKELEEELKGLTGYKVPAFVVDREIYERGFLELTDEAEFLEKL